MNGPELFNQIRNQLAHSIARRSQVPAFNPIRVSPWVAMALLQKAIRRGRADFALQAAATLLLDGPDRLWRRCGGIAFEDIGLADLNVVGVVTAGLAGKRLRASLGGEWSVASLMVSLLTQANKCRSADDLLMCAERHPAFADARRELAELPTRNLLEIVTSPAPLIERGLALWYALGTDHPTSKNLVQRRGQPQAVFDRLCEAGLPHTVVEIAREGFRKTGEVLCPFVALLSSEQRTLHPSFEDDQFPPEEMIGAVPSWALDIYSREGRLALKSFIGGDSNTARWVRAHVPGNGRVNFLGNILFAVEGGQMRQRQRWPTGDQLRSMADRECHPHCPDAAEILELMRADISNLNEVRGHLHGGLGHAG